MDVDERWTTVGRGGHGFVWRKARGSWCWCPVMNRPLRKLPLATTYPPFSLIDGGPSIRIKHHAPRPTIRKPPDCFELAFVSNVRPRSVMPMLLNESRFKNAQAQAQARGFVTQSRIELLFPTRTQRARIFSDAFQPHFGHAVKGCGDEFPPRYCHCRGDTQRDAVSGGWGWRSRMMHMMD